MEIFIKINNSKRIILLTFVLLFRSHNRTMIMKDLIQIFSATKLRSRLQGIRIQIFNSFIHLNDRLVQEQVPSIFNLYKLECINFQFSRQITRGFNINKLVYYNIFNSNQSDFESSKHFIYCISVIFINIVQKNMCFWKD